VTACAAAGLTGGFDFTDDAPAFAAMSNTDRSHAGCYSDPWGTTRHSGRTYLRNQQALEAPDEEPQTQEQWSLANLHPGLGLLIFLVAVQVGTCGTCQ
jgi:hypothetical protein